MDFFMKEIRFISKKEQIIPHLSESEMREVDRIAVKEYNLGVLQMMENAGRNLAIFITRQLKDAGDSEVLIFAGSGGNGGGGLCAARHLINHGVSTNFVLSKDQNSFKGAAKIQLDILERSNNKPLLKEHLPQKISEANIIVDAMIGYSLKGDPKGISKVFIDMINRSGKHVISLDIPTGIDSTSGDEYNPYVKADQTMTLALPKTGLHNPNAGELYLADIGIPPTLYSSLDIKFEQFWDEDYIIQILRKVD